MLAIEECWWTQEEREWLSAQNTFKQNGFVRRPSAVQRSPVQKLRRAAVAPAGSTLLVTALRQDSTQLKATYRTMSVCCLCDLILFRTYSRADVCKPSEKKNRAQVCHYAFRSLFCPSNLHLLGALSAQLTSARRCCVFVLAEFGETKKATGSLQNSSHPQWDSPDRSKASVDLLLISRRTRENIEA